MRGLLIGLLCFSTSCIFFAGCDSAQNPIPVQSSAIQPAVPQLVHSHNAVHGGVVESIGDNHAEMSFDSKNGTLTLYISNLDEKPSPIDARPISIQVKPEGTTDYLKVELNAIPQSGEPAGQSSRFTGGAAELAGAKALVAVARIPANGSLFRAQFHFVPGRSPAYVCPMGCEKDKVYPQAGKCPVCHMELVERSMAHSDHSPKHGGIFFMAADQWHHLEGVLVSPTEFRIYLYNDFTRPLSAASSAKGSSITLGDGSAPLLFASSERGEYLSATLPAGAKFPLSITAKIAFEGQPQASVFDFHFERISNFH